MWCNPISRERHHPSTRGVWPIPRQFPLDKGVRTLYTLNDASLARTGRIERQFQPRLYNPVKGGGYMVVSNRRVAGDARERGLWHDGANACWSRIVTLRLNILAFLGSIHPALPRPRATPRMTGHARQYVTIDRTAPDYLRERSLLMFRRENQEESFDEDVAALRDQVGSGRREQTESESLSGEDQTTYSPPRQTWTPVGAAPAADPESGAPAQRLAVDPANASIVAPDTVWDGNVQSSGSLHIHGQVSGQIRAEGDVFVAEGATVNAEVHAGNVTVAGTLEGAVECTGRFEVMPSGRVAANVAAPRLVVHEGAAVVGKLRMTTE